VDEILPPEARPQGPTSTKEGEPYIDPLFKDQGRRLTQVDHLTELRPMWSPTGEWIAFTGADLGTGVVCPYVCRPDGGELTRLLEKSQFTNQLGSSNWKELGGLPEDASLFPSFAVEWSPDGRMLLLNQGGPYAGIDVAWWDGTRWLGRALGGYASSHSAIRWVAFGPDGKWVAYVDGGASDYEERIVLHRTEHGGEGSGRFLDLPAGWRILWFDW
jgi:Tol biopolymer transport system component